MTKTQIALFITLLVCVCSFQRVMAQELVLEKIVAKVGNELLLKTEIEQTIAYQEERNRRQLTDEDKCLIINDLLTSKLLVAQAAIDSIEVADAEVERELQNKIDYILSLMDNDVELFQQTYGKTVNEVREAFRSDLKKQLTAQRMRGTLTSEINITPAEVFDFYSKIPSDSLPFFHSEVEVGEILYYPKVNEQEKQRAKSKLEEIRDRIVSKEATFSNMAIKFSDDPGSGKRGGNLGWQKRGTFVPAFEAAAYRLKPGELSDIVESEFGFHLIELLERRGNSILTRHILIEPEITEKDVVLAKLKLDSIVDLLQSDSMSFELAVKRFSDENTQSYNNGGRMINPATGKTFFETPELDPDVYLTIDKIEVGDVSEPIFFEDPYTRKSFYRILKLFSRTPPHQADIQRDYSKIKDAAIQHQRSAHVQKWVTETIDKTYVYLDPEYIDSDCPVLSSWHEASKRTKN